MRISDWSSDVCSSDLLSLVYLRASIPGRWETITTPNAGGGRCGGQLSGPGDTPGTRCWTRIPAWSYRQKCITRGLAMKPIFEKVPVPRSEEHTSELQSLMRNSYAAFCLKKKNI